MDKILLFLLHTAVLMSLMNIDGSNAAAYGADNLHSSIKDKGVLFRC
jgi:hypothetical protein